MPEMDEPDRTSEPPLEADDQPPPSRTAPATGRIEIDLYDATGTLTPGQLQSLQSQIETVLALLPNTGQVRVRIVDDAEMIEAHNRYCDLPTTTDVLTFDLAEHESPDESKELDTDLILCLDEAQRQALQFNHDRTHELLLYTLHGVLHCLGYDDHTDSDYKAMHTKEDELLTQAGIGALFNKQRAQENSP